jgi:siroheme synthase (precorrin-2 oxidase/ferrochelatase)
VYGNGTGGATNWGSYFIGSNYMSGDLRIATTTEATGYTLSVNGKIACEEVLVQDMASWPDYVFKSDYNLMSLHNLEQSIKENGHLPGLPSAQDIETNGLHLGNMQKQVVEKVEELTLYTIEQAKMLQELKQEFKKEIDALKAENASLKKAIKN